MYLSHTCHALTIYFGCRLTGTLANSEDPDEMPHEAAFHQGLHCLLRQKQSPEIEIHNFIEMFDKL